MEINLISTDGLGNLAKPVTKLITVVAAGIGRCYEPLYVRRLAQATAEARIVGAEAESAAEAIRLRAQARQAYVEERRQGNIESVAKKAERLLPNEVSETPVDDDWSFTFFEQCKDTSSNELQDNRRYSPPLVSMRSIS